MSRYERRQYFEALCQMKDGYANRSADDRRSALSVEDAIIYAEAVMAALEVDDEMALIEEEAALATETSSPEPRD
jgi:hypothetical protein